jgi:8-oxo-dGTP diphosphatase
MTAVVVGLIVREDFRVLMTKRHPDGTRPDLWEFPGGKVDIRETHRDALHRELQEELGVETEVGDRLGGCILHLEQLFILDLYRCRIVRGEPRPLVTTALDWIDLDQAVVYLPLVPSCYLFYETVRRYLHREREKRLVSAS